MTFFHILQTGPLFWRRVNRLGQHRQLTHKQRAFAGFRAAESTSRLDNIKRVELIAKPLEPLIADVSPAEPELDLATPIFDVGESDLAHNPSCADDAPGESNHRFGSGQFIKRSQCCADGMAAVAAGWKGINSGGAQLCKLGGALGL